MTQVSAGRPLPKYRSPLLHYQPSPKHLIYVQRAKILASAAVQSRTGFVHDLFTLARRYPEVALSVGRPFPAYLHPSVMFSLRRHHILNRPAHPDIPPRGRLHLVGAASQINFFRVRLNSKSCSRSARGQLPLLDSSASLRPP